MISATLPIGFREWWRTHGIPPAICQMCCRECETTEIVGDAFNEPELWCYCKRCEVDTFHPLIEDVT